MKKPSIKKPLRILHCPTNVGGNPQGLARAERELGLESRAIAFSQNYFEFEMDEILWKEGEHPFLREAKRFRLFFRALLRFDIIHFNFGQTIFPFRLGAKKEQTRFSPSSSLATQVYYRYPYWMRWLYDRYAHFLELNDLLLLSKIGKGIVVTYQGDDARQGEYCRAYFEINPATEVDPGYYSYETDQLKAERIKKVARYADRIYALNPDLLHVLPPSARFLPYANVDLRHLKPNYLGIPREPLIIHAPSHKGVKGTKYILEAVSRLKGEGVPFQFYLVEGLKNVEARKLYRQADLLVDQLLCGWYGGVAVEFMALGKPVVCYLREKDLSFIPERMRKELPIIPADPRTIYQVLKNYLTIQKKDLPEIGRRSRVFVERWHDPLKIAAKLKEEYEAIIAKKTGTSSIVRNPGPSGG